MTDSTPQSPAENVGRGTLFTLLAIPLAIVGFAIVGTWGSYFVFVVSLFVPAAAAFLYRAGSGGTLGTGRAPFILVSLVAVVIGVATGVVATAFAQFSAVGGDGGLFGSLFQSTLVRQLGTEDYLIQALVGLGLGVAGVFGALRSSKTLDRIAANAPVVATTLPEGTAAPGTPIAPPAAPAVTPPIAKPSPGIILNGEPLDPDALK